MGYRIRMPSCSHENSQAWRRYSCVGHGRLCCGCKLHVILAVVHHLCNMYRVFERNCARKGISRVPLAAHLKCIANASQLWPSRLNKPTHIAWVGSSSYGASNLEATLGASCIPCQSLVSCCLEAAMREVDRATLWLKVAVAVESMESSVKAAPAKF